MPGETSHEAEQPYERLQVWPDGQSATLPNTVARPNFVRRASIYIRKVSRKGCTVGPLMMWVGDELAPGTATGKAEDQSATCKF
jgi:hypothetical protein